jgi:hypothetical protein
LVAAPAFDLRSLSAAQLAQLQLQVAIAQQLQNS